MKTRKAAAWLLHIHFLQGTACPASFGIREIQVVVLRHTQLIKEVRKTGVTQKKFQGSKDTDAAELGKLPAPWGGKSPSERQDVERNRYCGSQSGSGAGRLQGEGFASTALRLQVRLRKSELMCREDD